MKKIKVVCLTFFAILTLIAPDFMTPLMAQYPQQLLSPPRIPNNQVSISISDWSNVNTLQAGINDARRQEEVALGLCNNSIARLTMPAQTMWDSWTIDQKTLFLLNDERRARGGVIYNNTQTSTSGDRDDGPRGPVRGYPFSGVFKPVDDAAQFWTDWTVNNDRGGHCQDAAPAGRRCPAERISYYGGNCTPHQGLEVVAGGEYRHGNLDQAQLESMIRFVYGSSGHRYGVLGQHGYKDDYGNPREEGYLGFGVSTDANTWRAAIKMGDTASDAVYQANGCNSRFSWNARTSDLPGCTRYIEALETEYQPITAGGTYRVPFTSSPCFKEIISSVRIRMSVDGGNTFPNNLILADNIPATNTTATVNIPNGINTTNVVIIIESASNSNCVYFSDEVVKRIPHCTPANAGTAWEALSLRNFTLRDAQNRIVFRNEQNTWQQTYENFYNATPIHLVASATLKYGLETSTQYNKDIWIDRDRNGVFDFPQDRIMVSTQNNGTFTVPTDLAHGTYRMRVRVVGNYRTDPCFNEKWGQTEDYRLVIGNTMGSVDTGEPSTSAIVAGTYTITARHSNKLIDGVKNADGSFNVLQWEANGRNNQKWVVEPIAGTPYFYLKCVGRQGRYVEVTNADRLANVRLNNKIDGSLNQQFIAIPTGNYFQIAPRANQNIVFDVDKNSPENGGNIHLWTKGNYSNQQFTFTRVSGSL